MAGLEPPIPATAADHFIDASDDGDRHARVEESVAKFGKWRRTTGLCLLALVVFLWTATNFLASRMMADHSYDKPFFVTYFNTSIFILPMIPALLRKAYRKPEELQQFGSEVKSWIRTRQYSPLKQKDSNEDVYIDRLQNDVNDSLLSPTQGTIAGPFEVPLEDHQVDVASTAHLTLGETARLSLEFCILWFLANYLVLACLQYTTVASATILTSTSSVFTLIFGAIFGAEKFTFRKLIGVLASLAGVILVSSVDLSGNSADDEHRGDFPEKTYRELVIGDVLAFLSAVMYGIYAVFMKKRIADESLVNMPIFFGFVGLTNIFLLWPGIIILHFTGIERFALPSGNRVVALLFCNAFGSMLADLAWAYAVLLTSPIVVTVGLSLTIPITLIGQIVLNSQSSTALYWIGAVVVVLSFIIVNQESKKDDMKEPQAIHTLLSEDR